jgi:hypothetical protein
MSEESPKALYWLPALLTLVAAGGLWVGTELLSKHSVQQQRNQEARTNI